MPRATSPPPSESTTIPLPQAHSLPIPGDFDNVDDYIEHLIELHKQPFIATLCGGVHILDFFARDPPYDVYTQVLPQAWCTFLESLEMSQILELLLHSSTETILSTPNIPADFATWIIEVRKGCLNRDYTPPARNNQRRPDGLKSKEANLFVGMKEKKIHEVAHFADFVDDFASSIEEAERPTHIVDFGSGQGYLPRLLAVRYGWDVVGLEGREENLKGAREMDAFVLNREQKARRSGPRKTKGQRAAERRAKAAECCGCEDAEENEEELVEFGKVDYIHTFIESGDLNHILPHLPPEPTPKLTIISLHSCGNLLHHALKSLVETPNVTSLAVIGCCYNLMTERYGTTYKPPLRVITTPYLFQTADENGYPLSHFLREEEPQPEGRAVEKAKVHLNITARSMACQAIQNWTNETSDAFFTRHFYRALLQRVLVDRKIVNVSRKPAPEPEVKTEVEANGETKELPKGTPIIIGSLRKPAYASFKSYVTHAMPKIKALLPHLPESQFQIPDEEVEGYTERFGDRRKQLCIIWTLMAFVAGLVESLILVDRLKFCEEVFAEEERKWRESGPKEGKKWVRGRAWVRVGFEFEHSPRNLVICAVKGHEVDA
ncbi:hypothetical protein BJ508DRAFT_410081 [Ascobolus immersus RN42]|uniref:Methyltransferase domain-containing protein n=1 Tax=Ascobolus immersus RN42 TaxID=1160509 RepID=A0A3N4J2V9_ASCIM|nr:hypothetical protein BJ508DRAFT_410081 [Ascobolus immersus RN42]